MATGFEREAATPYATDRPARTEQEIQRLAKILVGTFSAETVAAATAVILAILGLAEIYPEYMLPIAAILVGAAFLIKGAGISSRYRQLADEAGGGIGPRIELAGGISADICGGLAGIVLGVLALLNVVPGVLLAVSVIVFGATLLFSGGETYRVNQLQRVLQRDDTEYDARLTAEAAGGGEALVGIAAIVLGILALTGIQPAALLFGGILAVAGIMMLSGLASGTHAALLLRR